MSAILATQKAEIGRIMVPGQPRKKFAGLPSEQKNMGMVEYVFHISDGRKHKTGGLWSRLACEKSEILSLK
jgi:hypothetical protein